MRLSLLLAAALFAVCSAIEEVEVDASVDDEPQEETYTTGDAFTAEEREQIEQGQEKHEFKAEVSRLMDIIINSLYSNREIFLRELISNSADALDKARFMALTDEAILAENENFDIKIQADESTKTITITDAGVGMTKADLQNNLGVVAKSGTTEFLEKAAAGQDSLSLIGQFGVGFYSVYLVADKVTVVSKNHDDEQYIWESTAQNEYTIAKDPRGNTLGRGTSIILHLKPDAEDFLNNVELERLITHYSQFINFPIFLHETETVEKEVPVEKSTEATEDKTDDEDMEVSEEEDEADAEETETITEEIESWKRINDIRPIWTKSPADVTEEEYNEFYKDLTNDEQEPLEKMHFVAEGEISFRALLYVPKADKSVYENYNGGKSNNIKLYVRRVLISDEFDEFLPKRPTNPR
jgi:heat shock protein beta